MNIISHLHALSDYLVAVYYSSSQEFLQRGVSHMSQNQSSYWKMFTNPHFGIPPIAHHCSQPPPACDLDNGRRCPLPIPTGRPFKNLSCKPHFHDRIEVTFYIFSHFLLFWGCFHFQSVLWLNTHPYSPIYFCSGNTKVATLFFLSVLICSMPNTMHSIDNDKR